MSDTLLELKIEKEGDEYVVRIRGENAARVAKMLPGGCCCCCHGHGEKGETAANCC